MLHVTTHVKLHMPLLTMNNFTIVNPRFYINDFCITCQRYNPNNVL